MRNPTGERRHESCRYSDLSEAWYVAYDGKETASIAHLCRWSPGPCPPALARMWGGVVEPDRDCAACPVYDPLTLET